MVTWGLSLVYLHQCQRSELMLHGASGESEGQARQREDEMIKLLRDEIHDRL